MPDDSANRLPPCQDELLELFDLSVSTIFCAKDVAGIYRAVNLAFVRRTGRRSKRDVLGRRADELFPAPMASRYEEQDRVVFDRREPLRDELELVRRENGDFGWYLTTKLPVPAEDEPDRLWGLVSISRDLATPSDEGIAMESLHGMVRYVHANLHRPLPLRELADAAGCPESQLSRRVRKVFGISPTQFVLRSRIDRAADLLAERRKPLAEIAADTGFYDQAVFTRQFARLVGDTPAQFRARAE